MLAVQQKTECPIERNRELCGVPTTPSVAPRASELRKRGSTRSESRPSAKSIELRIGRSPPRALTPIVADDPTRRSTRAPRSASSCRAPETPTTTAAAPSVASTTRRARSRTRGASPFDRPRGPTSSRRSLLKLQRPRALAVECDALLQCRPSARVQRRGAYYCKGEPGREGRRGATEMLVEARTVDEGADYVKSISTRLQDRVRGSSSTGDRRSPRAPYSRSVCERA